MTHSDPEKPPQAGWRRRNLRVSSVLWGAAVWVALWGDVSVANVLAGAALGLVVALVFPLPPLPRLRPNPVAVLRLLGGFLVDVVVASAQVVRVILVPGDLRSSVVAVCMRSESDLVATIVGQMHSLVPGSIMVDIRRSDHTLYLHVLDTPDHDAVRAVRDRALVMEARVLAALGMQVPPHPPQERETAAGRGGER
jgi:multicomponent Na+:H+ antiporter subunit E